MMKRMLDLRRFGLSDPFLVIKAEKNGKTVELYRSEVKLFFRFCQFTSVFSQPKILFQVIARNLNPEWKEIQIKTGE